MGQGSGQQLTDRLPAGVTRGEDPLRQSESRNRPGVCGLGGFRGQAPGRRKVAADGRPPDDLSRGRRLTRGTACAVAIVLLAAGATGARAEQDRPGEGLDRAAPTAANDPAEAGLVEAGLVEAGGWERQWRADEALLAERWPELEDTAEETIKQRFREIRRQAEQARQGLTSLTGKMDQRHHQQHEAMQARHERERAEAAAEGALALTQADQRHRQERAALQRDQDSERAQLAQAGAEIEQHLESARRDVAEVRESAVATDARPEDVLAEDAGPEETRPEEIGPVETRPEREDAVDAGRPEAAETGAHSGDIPAEAPLVAPYPGIAPASPDPASQESLTQEPITQDPTSREATGPEIVSPEVTNREVASEELADLVARGDALLDLGDLAAARLFYRRAAGQGSAEGAMRMGMTFDPLYFAQTGVHGTQPRSEEALEWYRKAVAMGSRPAEGRLETLRSWLERSAPAGDAQALQQRR